MTEVICPYCQTPTKFVGGKTVYGFRASPEQIKRNYYHCAPCNAHVGTHRGTTIPYGIPANAELRHKRSKVHSVFDKLWTNKMTARQIAYFWLAIKMQIPTDDAHIGMFNDEQCERAMKLLKEREISDLL